MRRRGEVEHYCWFSLDMQIFEHCIGSPRSNELDVVLAKVSAKESHSAGGTEALS
jgi:hypothetical protein